MNAEEIEKLNADYDKQKQLNAIIIYLYKNAGFPPELKDIGIYDQGMGRWHFRFQDYPLHIDYIWTLYERVVRDWWLSNAHKLHNIARPQIIDNGAIIHCCEWGKDGSLGSGHTLIHAVKDAIEKSKAKKGR